MASTSLLMASDTLVKIDKFVYMDEKDYLYQNNRVDCP